MDPESSKNLAHAARGAFGERLAAREYERRGCRVLDRNWRTSVGELDLVVLDGRTYVFCEVKARRTDRFGPPSAAVGPRKQARIRRLAIDWLRANGCRGVAVRFDVVSVLGTEVQVLEAAF